MKKKTLLFTFALVGLLILSFAFVACDRVADKILGDDITGGEEYLDIDKDESVTKMNDLAQTKGYQIAYNFTENGESGNFEIGYKGDSTWMISNNDYTSGIAIKMADDNTYYYYDYEDGKFVYDGTYTGSDYGSNFRYLQSSYIYWLYYGNSFDGMLSKGADTTIAGRSCYTYKYNPGLNGLAGKIIGGYSMEYKIAVDKELGITMKVEIDVESGGESASMSFVVTSFKTGDAVVVPELKTPVAYNVNLPENVKITYSIDDNDVVFNKVGDQIYVSATNEGNPKVEYFFEYNEQFGGYAMWERDFYYDYEKDEYVSDEGWYRYRSYTYFSGSDVLAESYIGFMVDEDINDATLVDGTETVAGMQCVKYVFEDVEYEQTTTYFYNVEQKFVFKYVSDYSERSITSYTLNAGVIPTDLGTMPVEE